MPRSQFTLRRLFWWIFIVAAVLGAMRGIVAFDAWNAAYVEARDAGKPTRFHRVETLPAFQAPPKKSPTYTD